MRRIIVFSFVSLFLSSMAWAQEKTEAPVWNAGDKWVFKRADGVTFSQEVVEVKEDSYIVKMGGEKDLYVYDRKTMNVRSMIEEGGRQVKATSNRRRLLDFPFSVGKKWTDTTISQFVEKGGRSSEATFVNDFKIERIEEVMVPAGIFKAYRISYKQTNMAGGSGSLRFWYSPEAKMWVKREAEKSGYWVRIAWAQDAELVTYKLK